MWAPDALRKAWGAAGERRKTPQQCAGGTPSPPLTCLVEKLALLGLTGRAGGMGERRSPGLTAALALLTSSLSTAPPPNSLPGRVSKNDLGNLLLLSGLLPSSPPSVLSIPNTPPPTVPGGCGEPWGWGRGQEYERRLPLLYKRMSVTRWPKVELGG